MMNQRLAIPTCSSNHDIMRMSLCPCFAQGFLAIVMDHAACGDLLKRVDVAKKAGHPLQEEPQLRNNEGNPMVVYRRSRKKINKYLYTDTHLLSWVNL